MAHGWHFNWPSVLIHTKSTGKHQNESYNFCTKHCSLEALYSKQVTWISQTGALNRCGHTSRPSQLLAFNSSLQRPKSVTFIAYTPITMFWQNYFSMSFKVNVSVEKTWLRFTKTYRFAFPRLVTDFYAIQIALYFYVNFLMSETCVKSKSPKIISSDITYSVKSENLIQLLALGNLTHRGLMTPYNHLKSGSTPVQVMACCLPTPSHHLKELSPNVFGGNHKRCSQTLSATYVRRFLRLFFNHDVVGGCTGQ